MKQVFIYLIHVKYSRGHFKCKPRQDLEPPKWPHRSRSVYITINIMVIYSDGLLRRCDRFSIFDKSLERNGFEGSHEEVNMRQIVLQFLAFADIVIEQITLPNEIIRGENVETVQQNWICNEIPVVLKSKSFW